MTIQYVYGEFVSLLKLLDAHLRNGTGHRTLTMTPPPLLTTGPVKYEAVGVRVPTCDSAHSWQFYSPASLEHQAP